MNTVISNTEEKMEKTIAALERDYKAVRLGRATPTVLDRITVDYYGVPTPIQQMAAVSVPEPRMLQIQPWDASTLKEIEKAIQQSDIGINPQNDGRIIRLVFPPLTEERRKEVVKEVRKTAEDSKVAIRNSRRDSFSRPTTGSSFPCRASAVRSRLHSRNVRPAASSRTAGRSRAGGRRPPSFCCSSVCSCRGSAPAVRRARTAMLFPSRRIPESRCSVLTYRSAQRCASSTASSTTLRARGVSPCTGSAPGMAPPAPARMAAQSA